jgi:hypothetical protein
LTDADFPFNHDARTPGCLGFRNDPPITPGTGLKNEDTPEKKGVLHVVGRVLVQSSSRVAD